MVKIGRYSKWPSLVFLPVMVSASLLGAMAVGGCGGDEHTLTVAVAPASGGTINLAEGDHKYDKDTEVTITATPAAGWQFTGWTGDVADATAAVTTVTMDEDKVVTAGFEEDVLSYESILQFIKDYFALLETIGPDSGPEKVEEIKDWLAPDFVANFGMLQDRQEWAEYVVNQGKQMQYIFIIDEPPYYWMIDDRKKTAAGMIREDLQDRETGEIVETHHLMIQWGFTEVDGEIKALWEQMSPRGFPEALPYLSDRMKDELLPAWLDMLPE